MYMTTDYSTLCEIPVSPDNARAPAGPIGCTVLDYAGSPDTTSGYLSDFAVFSTDEPCQCHEVDVGEVFNEASDRRKLVASAADLTAQRHPAKQYNTLAVNRGNFSISVPARVRVYKAKSFQESSCDGDENATMTSLTKHSASQMNSPVSMESGQMDWIKRAGQRPNKSRSGSVSPVSRKLSVVESNKCRQSSVTSDNSLKSPSNVEVVNSLATVKGHNSFQHITKPKVVPLRRGASVNEYHRIIHVHPSHSANEMCTIKHNFADKRVRSQTSNPFCTVSKDVLKLSSYGGQFGKLLARGSAGSLGRSFSRDAESVKNFPRRVRIGSSPKSMDSRETIKTSNSLTTQKCSLGTNNSYRTTRLYSVRVTTEASWRSRLQARKRLFRLKNKIANFSLLFAMAGIALAVLDAELTGPGTGIDKFHPASLFIRGTIVLSTLVLLCLITCYHVTETKMYGIESGADDWRVAVTPDRLTRLFSELAVCSVSPFPGTSTMYWPYFNEDGRSTRMVEIPVDVILALPMFLRSYLICRFMVLHSKQFKDAATKSIAALNQITMDFKFVLKTMMYEQPVKVMVVFTIGFWVCMAWIHSLCERFHDVPESNQYLNALWVVMVTFMSIGYGDIVPNTYCGRGVAIFTGMVGCGVSAGLIAVITRKLELTRAEKHVNNFMTDSKLTQEQKNAAAAVLQQTWFIHKFKTLHRFRHDRVRLHQRRFLRAINQFRRIKWKRRKLTEQGSALLDINKIRLELAASLTELSQRQDLVQQQVTTIAEKMTVIQKLLEKSLLPSSPVTVKEPF